MRIVIPLLLIFWSAVAAAQQFEEETTVPTPSGGPSAPGMPPPPGAPPPPGVPTRPPDDFAPPPASEMPAASKRPEAPPPGTTTTAKTDGPNVVKVHKDERGYQLLVDGKPTMVFGMNWGYMPIGENYTYNFWGKPDDVIIEALDAEMTLLKEMHVNVIRQYLGIPPRWIKYIYEKYGIYTMINHPVARYGMTIDGVWVNPVDYSDPRFRDLIIEEITAAGRRVQRHAWSHDVAARQREQLRTGLEVVRDREPAQGTREMRARSSCIRCLGRSPI